jgi:hypothetical protein
MPRLSTILFLAAATTAFAQPSADSDRDRAEALQRIAQSDNPTAEPMLAVAAGDASPVIRQAALMGLAGRAGALRAETRLAVRKALADQHPLVVLAAVEVLQGHRDPNAADALARLATRPPACRDEHVLPGSVTGTVRTRPREIAEEAFRALGQTGWQGSPAVAMELLASRVAPARAQAAGAAATLAAGGKLDGKGREALLDALRPLLRDPSREARVAAAAAMARLGESGGSGILMDHLRRFREWPISLTEAEVTSAPEKTGAAEAGRPHALAGLVVEAVEALTGRDWGARDLTLWNPRGAGARRVAERVTQIEAALRAKGLATTPATDIVPRTLSEGDRALVRRLLAMGLFDPNAAGAGVERVAVVYDARTARGRLAPRMDRGWRVARGAKIFSTWGADITRVKQVESLDFAQEVAEATRFVEDRVDDWSSRTALALAAWSARLGREADAAGLLQALRGKAFDDDDMLDMLRRFAAGPIWMDAVHAFIVAADEEALAEAERLMAVAGEYADDYGRGRQLLAELKRRKAAGTLGKVPATQPADPPDKSLQQQVAAFIAALEDVAVRQEEQTGGVDLASAAPVRALIAIGDPAVPALIECVRGDGRLTRSVHFARDFIPNREVLGVREAALTAVQSILRKTFFVPRGTGDDFTSSGPAQAKAVAAEVEKYWQAYGRLPLGKRMMLVLTDPRSGGADLRDAAMNLATLQYGCVRGTMAGTMRLLPGPRQPSPAAAQFADPTAAEAILKAMDRDLVQLAQHLGGDLDELARQRDSLEDQYVTALMHLGDKSIVPELLKRYQAADSTRMKRKFAGTTHWLGESSAITEFARQFEAGGLALGKGDAAGKELRECVRYLGAAKLPACEKALEALTDAKQPYHPLARRQVRDADIADPGDGQWFAHPVCLRLLAADLADTTPDGVTYAMEDDSLTVRTPGGAVRQLVVPDLLAGDRAPRKQAAGRRCDAAAEKVGQLVFGAPEYHPLLADAGQRLAVLRRSLDLFRGRLVPAGRALRAALELEAPHVVFVPVMPALSAVATADDVAAGRAVFQQEGKGRSAEGWSLPATAAWKVRRDPLGAMARVLVVQAETTPDGRTRCGIIARHEVLAVDATDLVGVTAIGQ